MGSPAEYGHLASPSPVGDTIQQTTTGLVAYNKLTNIVSFTDGWRHWAMTARHDIGQLGTDPNPPPG